MRKDKGHKKPKEITMRTRVVTTLHVEGGQFREVCFADGTILDGVVGVATMQPDDGNGIVIMDLRLRLRKLDVKNHSEKPIPVGQRINEAGEPVVTPIRRSTALVDSRGNPLVRH